MDKLKLIKAKNKNKYPLDDEKERGVMQEDVDWLIEQAGQVEQMKQYIKNGIRWGYIDDREMEYKKFIE